MKLAGVLLVLLGTTLTGGASANHAVVLSGRGIGAVRLGVAQARAMHDLTAILGRPSRGQFTNPACAPTYTEVGWKQLYVEFAHGRLAGFRYIEDGWPPTTAGKRQARSDLPRLFTSRGITLGSTLAKARAAYDGLKAVGSNRWETPDRLVLYDNAPRYPDAPSSRIIEIKTLNACGDF